MTGTARSPFNPEDAPSTILLSDPPLLRVLAQVRFAPVLAVASESFVGEFQQALAERLPIASSDVELAIAFPPADESPPSPTRLWRFASADDAMRTTLGTSFVAFETSRYEGHAQFLAVLEEVLAAVADYIKPAQVQRLGIRYLQRLEEPSDLARLAEYMRPELLGILALPEAASGLDLTLTQARRVFDDATTLTARWGRLPAGVGLDVGEPATGESWVFDIDVFDESRSSFDPAELIDRARRHSRRQYQFFRWAVNASFLRRFGASEADLALLTEECEP